MSAEDFDTTIEADRGTTEPAMIVDVEGFEGPLDLLLALARQQKWISPRFRSWRWPISISLSSRRHGKYGSNWPPIIW